MDQRRNFFRVDTLIQVRFSDNENSSSLNCGYTTDLSAGGMLIHTHKRIPVGAAINLDFNLPNRKFVGDLKGKVVRVEKVSDTYKMAVEFINILEYNQDAIVKYLFDLQIMLRKAAVDEKGKKEEKNVSPLTAGDAEKKEKHKINHESTKLRRA